MEELYAGLGVTDYILLSVVLLISASIGIYYRFTGGRQKTNKVNINVHIVRLNLISDCAYVCRSTS